MITGSTFRNAIISGANNICNQKTPINDLNVFPVPDGDTGTNMSMTASAAASMLLGTECDEETPISKVSADVAQAMLKGARGNSGVILSLLFSGFADGCKGRKKLDGTALAHALMLGAKKAYASVVKPTEGTILTVARKAALEAQKAARDGTGYLEVLTAAYEKGQETLEQTPEMLPALKKAGVVDAGGKGYLVILEGMIDYLKTGKIVERGEEIESTMVADPAVLSEEEITFTYCTEFIVAKANGEARESKKLREYLSGIGDSIVVVENDEIIKVHVHTDCPDKALKKALKLGELENIKIENMRLQFRNRQELNAVAAPKEDYGIVAIANGDGIKKVFSDLGCAKIVSGGQTMNPSTEDILKACLATPAKTVFVLPNNKNIIMAANQAVPLAHDREIVVLPTKTIPQGICAALAFDSSIPKEEITEAMTEAIGRVRTGQITYAARDSEFDGNKIKKGQVLALSEDKLSFVDISVHDAAVTLAKSIAGTNSEYITVFYGADVKEADAKKLEEALCAEFPETDISLICGKQPIYSYILSVEEA